MSLPPTAGVLTAVATYDFREHNLGPQDAVQVFLIIHASVESGTVPVLLWLDPRTGLEHFFRGDFRFSEGPNVLLVSILFDNADAPRLVDLTNTVFTVAAAAPGATATAAVSASVASAAPNAVVVVQTATFQSSSQLKLTLATTQLGQVSQSLSALDGGGSGEASDGGADDALAKIVVNELEALSRDEEAPVLRSWIRPPQDAAPPTEEAPPVPQTPEDHQQKQSREEAPGRPDPANEQKTSHAVPTAASVLAVPLIGSIRGEARRRRRSADSPQRQARARLALAWHCGLSALHSLLGMRALLSSNSPPAVADTSPTPRGGRP